MAGGSKSSHAPKSRKRVEAEAPDTSEPSSATLKRAKNGSAFTRCNDCNKDVAMALIDFHNCSLDAKIKMNLEAQLIEAQPKKPPVSRKPTSTKSNTNVKSTKARTTKKNPNGRKRPQTAFFVFMDEFRKTFKAENPDCKSVATVAKEGGDKWKSLSEDEKKVYVDRAKELRAEYEKACKEDEEKGEEEVVEIVDDVKEEIEVEDDVEDEEKEDNNKDGEIEEGGEEVEIKEEAEWDGDK